MPTPPAVDAACRDAAWWNARIRELVQATRVWTPEALAELGRLRAEWARAHATEAGTRST